MLGLRTSFTFFFWLVVGGTAALWWVPAFIGEPKPISWQFGAVSLVVLWAFIFNHWPLLGTRRFFQESRFIKIEIVLLLFVSASFVLGFTLAA